MPPKYKALFVLTVIILIFTLNIEAGLILTFITLAFLLSSEPKLVRFFANPGFLIFAIVAIGVPLLLNFSSSELKQNLLIVSRGILITLLIYLYTKNFTNSNTYKKIRKFLPDELINLINISSGAITVIQEKAFKEFSKIKREKRPPFEHIVNFFYAFVKLAETISLTTDKLNSKKIIVLTGKIHEGKTTFASIIAEAAKKAGLKVGGILARVEIINEEIIAYHVEDVKTGKRKKLITKEPVNEYDDHFWSYFFLKEGMEFAQKCLSNEYLSDVNIVIIDEVGAMELENKGYDKPLSILLISNIPAIILVIREQFIEKICKKYNITPMQIVRVGENPEAVIKMIQDSLSHKLCV